MAIPDNSITSPPVGYETLFEGHGPIKADIVFVHGLRGHRTMTWMKDEVCWPKDLLPQEEAFSSHIRVLSFGYDANLENFTSQNKLFDHAQNLLSALARKRDGDLLSRPIIFVAHSLGGLIVKDAIRYSHSMSDIQPQLAATEKATTGIIFLGTPHRGGDEAGWKLIMEAVLGHDLGNEHNSVLQDLERNSQTLDRIGTEFNLILSRRPFGIFSFMEELPMSSSGRKVVENDSAVVGDAHERRESIHANHMNMVKFGRRDDAGYDAVVWALKELVLGDFNVPVNNDSTGSAEHQGSPSNISPPHRLNFQNPTTLNNIPNLLVPYFVPREGLLDRLRASFEQSARDSSPLVVVLFGMGGAGKTQISLEYCRRVKESGRTGGIFWIDGSSLNAAYRSMKIVARDLLQGREPANGEAAASAVRDVLSGWNEEWLMVFDNVDEPLGLSNISSLFPTRGHGSILVTSRCNDFRELWKAIQVDNMEEDEGLALLLGDREEDSEDRILGKEILELLGYLPLAIDQVRAHISKMELPLGSFMKEYTEKKELILTEIPKSWSYYRVDDGGDERPTSVYTTWKMSLSLLTAKGVDVLTIFAFFHPASISESIFRESFRSPSKSLFRSIFQFPMSLVDSPMADFQSSWKWSHVDYETATMEMRKLSLLQILSSHEGEIVVSLHPMVSEWLRMRLDSKSTQKFMEWALAHLRKYLESMNERTLTFEARKEVLSHIKTICGRISLEDDENHKSLKLFGVFYKESWLYNEAELMFDRALRGSEKAMGPDHSSTLEVVSHLGDVRRSRGRLALAEEMLDRALHGIEKKSGSHRSMTFWTLESIGRLYCDQNRHVEAEEMYNRALAGYEKVLGPDHVSIFTTVSRLGFLYKGQGHLPRAEEMFYRALHGFEKKLGPDHSSTLEVVSLLGDVHRCQGRLALAEKMLDRALHGFEKTFGADHFSTFWTFECFGRLYCDQNRHAEAEKMYHSALAGYEKTLGPDHISVFTTVSRLGFLYKGQGHLPRAEEMFDRALRGFEKEMGPDHSSTLHTVACLGDLYGAQGRPTEAAEMYRRAMAGGISPTSSKWLDTLEIISHPYLL